MFMVWKIAFFELRRLQSCPSLAPVLSLSLDLISLSVSKLRVMFSLVTWGWQPPRGLSILPWAFRSGLMGEVLFFHSMAGRCRKWENHLTQRQTLGGQENADIGFKQMGGQPECFSCNTWKILSENSATQGICFPVNNKGHKELPNRSTWKMLNNANNILVWVLL